MDRSTCISLLMAAGMTWAAATWLFHEQLARASERRRRVLVEHFVALSTEEREQRMREGVA